MRAVVVAVLLVSCGPIAPEETEELQQSLDASCIEKAYDAFPHDSLAAQKRAGQLKLRPQNFRILGCGDFTAKWTAAMKCAQERAEECLPSLNAEKLRKLRAAFRSGGVVDRAPLNVSCVTLGPECASNNAFTTSPRVPEQERWEQYQMLNMPSIQGMSAQELCTLALHEALHWAGFPGLIRDGVNHHNGTDDGFKDDVYSCGRYCGGPCAGGNPRADCYACAGTAEERMACGSRTLEIEKPCDLKLCSNERDPPSVGTRCFDYYAADCDGKAFQPSIVAAFCIDECPANFPNNSQPCSRIRPFLDTGPCKEPPPMCQR